MGHRLCFHNSSPWRCFGWKKPQAAAGDDGSQQSRGNLWTLGLGLPLGTFRCRWMSSKAPARLGHRERCCRPPGSATLMRASRSRSVLASPSATLPHDTRRHCKSRRRLVPRGGGAGHPPSPLAGSGAAPPARAVRAARWRARHPRGCRGDPAPPRAQRTALARAPGGQLSGELAGSEVEEDGKRRAKRGETGSCGLAGCAGRDVVWPAC